MHPLFAHHWLKAVAGIFLACVAAVAIAADKAGDVSFAMGEAYVVDAAGKTQAVARGSVVLAGQTLQTGASGHIHLRMVDGAFISVRPQSQLRIDEYHHDPATPSNNRLKFSLEKGTTRSISGRAGEAARENYRLNTPLAAIGIRGTDFVAQATNGITRVAVSSGAVVMSPLSTECLASALGPCNTAMSRVLTAAMQNAYLELRGRNEAPRLISAEKALESPNLVSPPRPEEPKASADKQTKTSLGSDNNDVVRDVVAESIKNQVNTTPVNTGAARQIWWGRWSAFIQPGQEAESVIAALGPDREPGYSNTVFGMLREKGTVQLPASGSARFQLAESETYVLSNNKTLTAAQISNPSLTIDFGARTYDTALTVNGGGISPVSIQSSGQITSQGKFKSTSSTANTTVLGILSNDTSQAGYLFQRTLSDNLKVVGATRWVR